MNWHDYVKMASPSEITYAMYKMQNIIYELKEIIKLQERQLERVRLRQECLECKLVDCPRKENKQ